MDSEIIKGLSYNEKRLLLALNAAGGVSAPAEIIKKGEFSLEAEIMGSASWLSTKGLVVIDEEHVTFYVLSDKKIAEIGLAERRAIQIIDKAGGQINMADLAKSMPGEDKIAVGWMKKKGLADIRKEGVNKVLVLTDEGNKVLKKKMPDECFIDMLTQGPISKSDVDEKIAKDLMGRQGMITENVIMKRTIRLTDMGREVIASGIELKEEIAQVTDSIIQCGKWKNSEFRKYDVQTFAPAVYPAKKHPLSRLGAEIRRLYTSMGFTEFDGEYVEPAFWDLDVLYVPQDHPARELQDTFYLSNPRRFDLSPYEDLIKKVKSIHENGGDTGSIGWGGKWSREIAEQALLRTHTTVNTITYVSKHPEAPAKVFSLSRIFRKESIDATHLPEFTQIEGIVIDENANFDMLVSLIKEFYSKMGFDQVRIRPAYFPYTEPSLETEVFFNGKWMELGGAGIFRPEVVAPFGVKYPVLAWGLGFERLAM
ncbi:MAG: phenylalanine--tRNA ligase subunit alpha, partial [archaeon]|nr:phenylalanine--tRNA ligase subunit alpha [archaeon]